MIRLLKVLVVALWSLSLSACVVPAVYGPHYRPVYPDAARSGGVTLSNALGPLTSPVQSSAAVEEKIRQGAKPANQGVWITGEAGTRIRFRFDDCSMQAYAKDEGGNFVLDWSVQKYSRCAHQLVIDNLPVVLEDLETGRKHSVQVFQRLFANQPPGLSIDKTVDLAESLPGYREVPVAERQYTVSLDFRTGFNAALPGQLTIQLPSLRVGSRQIQLPPLVMQRHGNIASRFSDYTPATSRVLSNYGALDKVWYEQDGDLALASSFSGWDDGKKWGDYYSSGIRGEIDIRVISGQPLRLEQPYAIWQAGDAKPIQMPLKRFNLVKYTTTRFNDPLAGAFMGRDPADGYRGQGKPFDEPLPQPKPIEPYDDNGVNAVVLVPDFKPKRVRVTLPRILVDGVVWPVQPIEFDYQPGSVEVIDAM